MDSLLKSYDEIVYIPMSSGLSNSCANAAMLASDEPFAGRVYVVDNHRISVTQMQSVLDACDLAAEGLSGRQIQETLERESLDASIYIAVDTLEYLKRGGRVNPCRCRDRNCIKSEARSYYSRRQAGCFC